VNEADGVVPNPRQEIPRRRSCDAIANEDGGTLLFRRFAIEDAVGDVQPD